MATLQLTLKKQWFDMIARGEKLEEYREIKNYYFSRLCNVKVDDPAKFKLCQTVDSCGRLDEVFHVFQFDEVVFINGYARNSPRIFYKIKEITMTPGARIGAP